MTGADLRCAREELGLSQAELARLFGVDVMTISRWERGESRITAPGAIALALECLRRSASINEMMASRTSLADSSRTIEKEG